MRILVLVISFLVTFLVFSVLYYIVKTKIAPSNQVHQRLKDLGGGEERVHKAGDQIVSGTGSIHHRDPECRDLKMAIS